MSETFSSRTRFDDVRDLAESFIARGVSEKTAWEWAEAETPEALIFHVSGGFTVYRR